MPSNKIIENINDLIDRVEHHIFATERELNIVSEIKSRLTQKQNYQDAHFIHLENVLKKIDGELTNRELMPEERSKEISAFGIDLENFETVLSLSIDKEQEAQSRISKTFTRIFLVGLVISSVIILKVAFQTGTTWTELAAQALALCASIFVLYILTKLTQSARESAERMDEKGVAIKFIRYGLRIILERPNEYHILQAGIGMFLGHHGQQSKPIEKEDFSAFTEVIGNLVKEMKPSDSK